MIPTLSGIIAVGALLDIFTAYAYATPITRQSITALSAVQISAFKPYSHFASAGYCQPSATLSWSCGTNCNANLGFRTVASGGDGSDVQFWFVGYDPTLQEVIVSHQGTDILKIKPLLTDVDFFLTDLDSNLLPGISSSVKVHNGFRDAHAKTATKVLAAVQQALSAYNATKVTIVGHSLGAAIATIDSVYLPLHLPASITFKTIGYGCPRVGNSAFSDYLDSHTQLTHINNREDFVPILPFRILGFKHGNGEVHIEDSGEWVICPGHDNTNDQCTTGIVDNIFEGDVSDHDGPYDGVDMGC